MGINLYFFNVLQFVVFFSQMQTQTLTLLFIDDVTGVILRFPDSAQQKLMGVVVGK